MKKKRKNKIIKFVFFNYWKLYFKTFSIGRLLDNYITIETNHFGCEVNIRINIFNINILCMCVLFGDEVFTKSRKSYQKAMLISFILFNFLFEWTILSKKRFKVE